MYLSKTQRSSYEEQGFLLLPQYMNVEEVELIIAETSRVFAKDNPGKVFEDDGETLRAIHGEELFKNHLFCKLPCVDHLLTLAIDILASEVYVHQYKITVKRAFKGDIWPWHQDSQYWSHKDGLPTDRALNVVIFLDEVNEYNAPLMLIPHSHKYGIFAVNKRTTDEQEAASWQAHMNSNLEDVTASDTVAKLVKQYGIEAPKGLAGSVLLFHPSCVHGSGVNMSPFDRKILIISYNSILNTPKLDRMSRPEFLANSNFTPLTPIKRDLVFDL